MRCAGGCRVGCWPCSMHWAGMPSPGARPCLARWPVSPGWPELAHAPIGPSADIIELQLPVWQAAGDALPDPHGGMVHWRAGGCQFDTGERFEGPKTAGGFAQACFSPAGRWFAACTPDQRMLVLWDRQRDRRQRLRGWRLSGWYREQPWLSRRDDDPPQSLHAVLGNHDED